MMTRYIAFLRAINAGPGHSVKMNILRQVFTSLGYAGVETFIASGNVIFETLSADVERLERDSSDSLRYHLGFETAVFIRTVAELARIAQYMPFETSETAGTDEINIIFMATAPDERLVRKIEELSTDSDLFRVYGREIYWLRRKNNGTQNFSSVPVEKTIGRALTIRGMKTVKRLVEKYSPNETLPQDIPSSQYGGNGQTYEPGLAGFKDQ